MNIKNYLFVLLISVSVIVQSACQTTKAALAPEEKIENSYLLKGDFKYVTQDNLGYTYLINSENEILKLNRDNEIIYKQSVRGLGDISSINVNNPQKIQVFYPDYQYIVFLDNTLSEMKRLNLEDFGFWNITATCVSRHNNIWIYDPVSVQLIKIDESGNTLISSNERYSQADKINSPTLSVDQNHVYLTTPDMVQIFDTAARFIKEIIIEKDKAIFSNGYMIYSVNNEIKLFPLTVEMRDNSNNVLYKSDSEINGFFLNDNTLGIIDENGFHNITIEN